MVDVTKEQILDGLRRLKGPDLSEDVVTLGLVSDIVIDGGKVFFSITVPAERASQLEPLRQAAEKLMKGIDGVSSAMVALTAEAKGKPARPAPSAAQMGAVIVSTPRIWR